MSMKEGPRILSKYVEGLIINNDVSENAFTIADVGGASGWVNVGSGVFQWRGYIDISGYRPEDMVIVPQAVNCEYGAAYFNSESAGLVMLQYAMTTDKVDDLDFGAGGIAEPLAGFIGDNSEMEQVIYAGTEIWGSNGIGMAMANIQKMVYGDAPPIVGPKIYICVRMSLTPAVVSGSPVDSIFYIPPMRFVIAGSASEIPEYQLLHLMKRQIDLQQSPDVDDI